MKLQERLDAFKASFESGAPPFNVPRSAIEIGHSCSIERSQPMEAVSIRRSVA